MKDLVGIVVNTIEQVVLFVIMEVTTEQEVQVKYNHLVTINFLLQIMNLQLKMIGLILLVVVQIVDVNIL